MQIEREGGFIIAKIHQVGGRVFTRLMKENSVVEFNPAQGRIIFALWQGDGIPIHVLAKRTALKKSTLTSMLDKLEQGGWIVRLASPHDRRSILVHLTDKHKEWQDKYVAISAAMNKLFYSGLSSSEIDKFEETLNKVLENVTSAEEALQRK